MLWQKNRAQQVLDAAALTKTRGDKLKAPADLITNRTRPAYGFIGPASKHIVLGILEALAGLPLPTSGEPLKLAPHEQSPGRLPEGLTTFPALPPQVLRTIGRLRAMEASWTAGRALDRLLPDAWYAAVTSPLCIL